MRFTFYPTNMRILIATMLLAVLGIFAYSVGTGILGNKAPAIFSAASSEFIAADDWSASLNITAEITSGEPSRFLTGNPIGRFGARPSCTNDFEFSCDQGEAIIVFPEELNGYFDYPDNQNSGFGVVDPLRLLTSRIPDAAVLTWPLRLEVALSSVPRDIDVTINSVGVQR